MTIHVRVKCVSCGTEFCFGFTPLPVPGHPRKDLLERFVCAECGQLTEKGKAFRAEWEPYVESIR